MSTISFSVDVKTNDERKSKVIDGILRVSMTKLALASGVAMNFPVAAEL
jgi:hypothetical protein